MLKLLLVVVVFAAVTYAALRLMERGRASGSPTGPRRAAGGPRRPAPRPVAPDDDDDFLRDLDRKRRKDPPD